MKFPIQITIRPIYLLDVQKLDLKPWQSVKLVSLIISSAASAVVANSWYQMWQNEPEISIPWTAALVGIGIAVVWNCCNTLIAWSEKMEKTTNETKPNPPSGSGTP